MSPCADGAVPDLDRMAGGKHAPAVHPTAIVDLRAEMGQHVEIGPNTIIGPDVTIGEGTRIGANCLIEGWTTIGGRCRIFHSVVIGTEPQDVKYRGERTFVRIGEANLIREFATINRATGEDKETRIGDNSFIMAYAHVAHNCSVGSGVIIANAVNMAGHVTIEDHASVSGVTVIHQFVRVGKYSYIGGGSRIPMDVAPYVMVAGYPARVNGLNIVGLRRHGFSPEVRRRLKEAYNLIFRSSLNTTQAVERIRSEVEQIPEILYLVEFIEKSQRGITL